MAHLRIGHIVSQCQTPSSRNIFNGDGTNCTQLFKQFCLLPKSLVRIYCCRYDYWLYLWKWLSWLPMPRCSVSTTSLSTCRATRPPSSIFRSSLQNSLKWVSEENKANAHRWKIPSSEYQKKIKQSAHRWKIPSSESLKKIKQSAHRWKIPSSESQKKIKQSAHRWKIPSSESLKKIKQSAHRLKIASSNYHQKIKQMQSKFEQ